MNTKRKAKSPEKTSETTPSNTAHYFFENPQAAEEFKQFWAEFGPMMESYVAGEGVGMNDITIRWDVEAIRGKDTTFVHASGTSTLKDLLSPSRIKDAPRLIEKEINEKIAMPVIWPFQHEINCMALADCAVKRDENDSLI